MTGPWPGEVTVVLLTGGSSRRLGRDKATAHVGGQRLLDRLLQGIPATVPVVLVGPAATDLPRPAALTREDPPGGGPLAGIGAGLARVDTPLVGILAVDLPFGLPVLRAALARLAGSPDPGAGGSGHGAAPAIEAVVPVDPGGHPQLLCAAYGTSALRQVLAGLAPLTGRPVRALRPLLRMMEWPVPAEALADVDTDEALQAARTRVAQQEGADVEQWVAAVREALGLDIELDVDAILDVARDAAHAVERPAAPVTTFLLGVAVARGADPRQAATTIAGLAADWPPSA